MSPFTQMKYEYQQITAPASLQKRITLMLRRAPLYRVVRRCGVGLAACLTLLVVSLNLSPALANAVADVPGLSGMVQVLTFGRYHYKTDYQSADVETPQVTGLTDLTAQQALNEDMEQYVQAMIARFEESVAAAPDAHLGLDVHYQLLAETDTYLSLDIYSSSAAGSSEDLHRYYTIEKPSGTLRTLSSFFHSDADYITPINDYLHQEMARQNAAEENFYWLDDDDIVSFTSITPDQAFYLDADGRIVICFAKYEIAPGSSGSPTFIIPEEVIAGLRTSDF